MHEWRTPPLFRAAPQRGSNDTYICAACATARARGGVICNPAVSAVGMFCYRAREESLTWCCRRWRWRTASPVRTASARGQTLPQYLLR